MALAVSFLLTGTLAAELSLLGMEEAGYVGAALLMLSAVTLVRLWWVGYPEPVFTRSEQMMSPSPRPAG